MYIAQYTRKTATVSIVTCIYYNVLLCSSVCVCVYEYNTTAHCLHRTRDMCSPTLFLHSDRGRIITAVVVVEDMKSVLKYYF